ERASRGNIDAARFIVHENEHDHNHSSGEHVHGRSYAQIRTLIGGSELSDFVKTRVLSVFDRIAIAEGKIHGVPAADVTFHEVGAVDSIIDIVAVCTGIEYLAVENVLVSHLRDGSGWIDCAHGKFPLPAPATLEILAGIPIEQVDEPFEFITPTGAAILAEFGNTFGLMPTIRIEKVGYGAGSRELPDRPNVLRAILGEIDDTTPSYDADVITRIETNLDDLSPEITGAVMDKLFAAGALDVFFTPIQMKKNRPAVQLSVLAEHATVQQIADLLFQETTAFGIRMDEVRRLKLERRMEKVATPFGEIEVKLGLREGRVIQFSPELESCRAASEQTGQPLRVIFQAAQQHFKAPHE
ncbi:MAG: nickel pincer cofactor biosynthesis protein LarC, partial [Verrucomicrobiota bacterium]|nr:nickel pincer cofactor biosynthesis protein LarC [Verrucomicrobiota bacterium]